MAFDPRAANEMTELIWEGKYRDGKRVAPVRIGLPFQTVETVNEGARDRERTLDLFARGKPAEWRNRLIWGDKKYVLPSLLPEFAGRVDLVYIDPPFDTGADFSFSTEIPDTDESLVKQPSMIERKAYRDTWGRGADSYVAWFYETAVLLQELLADTGSIYVHIGPNMNHLTRCVLDEVFGPDRFEREIIWQRVAARSHGNYYPATHDAILFYTKGDDPTWNQLFTPVKQELIESHYTHVEPGTGRRYTLDNCLNQNPNRPNLTYEWHGHVRTWRWTRAKMQALHDAGRLVYTSTGVARYKRYLDESKGVALQSVWTDIRPINSQAVEATQYPTQKPEALIERIISASSNAGDLVLDCFCGSGTTATVAEKLGRRWIVCDLGRFAVHTTRKRLLGIPGITPFVVQNLGKYERQAWLSAEFERPEDRAATEAAYRNFILDLYRAEPLAGYAWIHGAKAGRFVHVGAVDAPITHADVKAIARDVWRAVGKTKDGKTTSVDVLGWEFAFEVVEMAQITAAEARVDVKFKSIPRDVLDKRAVDQGDIQAKDFFELRAFDVKHVVKKRVATIELVDFMMPAEDLPDEVRRAVKHWSQWIDYWAIDWDFKNDTFHNEWQSYRTRDQPKLELQRSREYKEPGSYDVVIKVIDLLGCDTTKKIRVEVK